MLLVILVLGDPFGHPAYAQTADTTMDYPENRTASVATFFAYDQDGDAISWSLGGPDGDLFKIDDGMLAFREPPNYEDPQSATSGVRLSERNVYRVTVKAGGGAHDVAVTVTDVDEAGTASIDRRQPQVSRPLSASLLDEDEVVSGQRWQWSRSEDRTTWTDIEGAASPRRSPAQADEGMYLRATVTYSDKFGAGKTASAVSARRVEARTLSNAAPSFADQDRDKDTPYIDIPRSVSENTAVDRPVGRRVSATDADDDILFYELLDTPDLEDADGVARFTIDSASGQMRVGKVLGADSVETEDEDSTALTGSPALPDDEDADEEDNSEYVLRVRVSDPSTASATVNIIVTVRDVNEPPTFDEDVPTVLRVRENADPPGITFGDDDSPVGKDTFTVTDEDPADTARSYSVAGDDREVLAFDSSDILGFMADHKPDFEEKSSYSITVTARSGTPFRRKSSSLDVTIKVVDTEDVGEVSLSQRQGQVGIDINATVSDPDGGVSIRRWEWARSAEITVNEQGTPSAECRADPDTPLDVVDPDGWTTIDGASSAAYTPEQADLGTCLRATVFYTDNLDDTERQAKGVSGTPRAEQQDCQLRPEVRGPGPELAGRPVGQDEPEGAGEYGGRGGYR